MRFSFKTNLLAMSILTLCICAAVFGIKSLNFKVSAGAESDPPEFVNGIPTELAMYSGGEEAQTYQLTADVFDDETVRWTISSDPYIFPDKDLIGSLSVFPSQRGSAGIDQTGVITAGKSSETAVVTAKTADGSLIAECSVRFYNASQVNARLNALRFRGEDGKTLPTHDKVTEPSLYALAKFQSQMGMTDKEMFGAEVMRALFGEGAVTNNQTAESVVVTPSAAYVTHHFTRTLSTRVYPLDVVDKTVTWSSSDTSIATVSSTGVVTGVSVGTVTITAKAANGTTGECAFTVKPLLVKMIDVEPSLNLAVDMTKALNAEVFPSNASNTQLKWTSANPKIATVDSNGVVRGVSIGTTTITAVTIDGTNLKASCEVTVGKKITGISAVTPTLSIAEGKTDRIWLTITPPDAIIQQCAWKSSNPSIAEVDSNGTVFGVSNGTAVITAVTQDETNKTVSCAVTVTFVPLQGIKIARKAQDDPRSTRMFVGETEKNPFIATLNPRTATYQNVIWTSDNPDVASLNANGTLTGRKVGVTNLYATITQGKHGQVSSGKLSITVYDKQNSFSRKVSVGVAGDDNDQKQKTSGTGGNANDLIALALSQEGYQNGMSDGTTNIYNENGSANVYFPLNEYGGWTKYGYFQCPSMYVPLGEYNWCAAFINWCARKAKVPRANIEAGTSARLNSRNSFLYYKDKVMGVDVYTRPYPGYLIYFGKYTSGNIYSCSSYSFSHVGIVTKYTESTTTVETIEGNTAKDGKKGIVATKSYDLSKESTHNVIGFSNTRL